MGSHTSQVDPWRRARERYLESQGRFLEDLTDKERLLFEAASLENMFYSTSVAQNEHAENSTLRNAMTSLQPFCDTISQFGSAMDVYSNIAPSILCPIWGSVRVLLHVDRRGLHKYFERLVNMLAQIGDTLPRFREYENLFPSSLRLCLYISDAYLDIIKFCESAKTIFKKLMKQMLHVFQLMCLPFGWHGDHSISNLPKFWKAFAATGSWWTEKHQLTICGWLKPMLKWQSAFKEANSERQRLLDKLSTVDYRRRYRNNRTKCHKGTGKWLIESSQFRSWFQQDKSYALWCYGIPGCGKMTAMSGVLDYLFSTVTDPKSAVIYYYCDYQEPKSLEASFILGSLTKQILTRHDIPAEINLKLRDYNLSQLDSQDMAEILLIALKGFSDIYIIIDALNECATNDCDEVLGVMSSIMKIGDGTFKIFLFSQDHNQIRQAFNRFDVFESSEAIRVTEESINSDIAVVVRETVEGKEVGEICVAYLTFGDFESQLVRRDGSMQILEAAIRENRLFGRHTVPGRMYRYAHGNNTIPQPPEEINYIHHLGISNFQLTLAKYKLFGYVQENWFWHASEFTPQTTTDWKAFEHLVLRKKLMVKFKPWIDGYPSPDRPANLCHHSMFLWAAHNALPSFLLPIYQLPVTGRMEFLNSYTHEAAKHPRNVFLTKAFANPKIFELFYGALSKTEFSSFLRYNLTNVYEYESSQVLSSCEAAIYVLHRAADSADHELVELLLTHGVDPNVEREGMTALHRVAHAQLIPWVITRDREFRKNSSFIARTLLSHGVNIDAKDNNRTPADIARQTQNDHIVAILREYEAKLLNNPIPIYLDMTDFDPLYYYPQVNSH
ncbi:hypothetical protein BDD12DRAFT_893657 [Trichophaea hybrida]|nr:hypothetical protein BDD12DRAFT_893657 [Trichophaea hybrida]